MPFTKFRNGGRRMPRNPRRRRRRTFRRPMTAGRVKRIIDAELKVRDLGIGPVTMPSITGRISQITGIAQGDTNTTRTGNWIKPTSWMGTITVEGDSTNVTEDSVQYRVGCVMWKENETLNPFTLLQIMQDTSAPHQQYNIENKGQFKILWSRTGVLSNNLDNAQFQKIHRFYIKPPMKVLYDDADFKNNHLFIFAYSQVAAANNPPLISFDTRLRFTDS